MPDKDLTKLFDERRIEAVLIDYCAYLDRMDLAALSALFTEDCTVIYGDNPALRSQGRAALVTSLARMWRWARTAHHLSNPRIRFTDEYRAETESHVLAWHEAPDGRTATLFGRYLDRLEKQGGDWRIAERRMDMNGADSGFTLPLPRAPRAAPPVGWQKPEGL
ncbi:nuclear transport factor 2 family protein [Tateyamaria pelophila]|uniref:nuclear transport factor 2 family protein n=1 Tax=Tateyamaria pelophila TaxID=328415 RepID=UPI001CBB5C02|nr:nuclear transport factor 2 family protein [Tateyamaria pelophila]